MHLPMAFKIATVDCITRSTSGHPICNLFVKSGFGSVDLMKKRVRFIASISTVTMMLSLDVIILFKQFECQLLQLGDAQFQAAMKNL